MTATDLENLNGSQIAAVVDAIRLSFDEAQFAMLLRRRLNKALADLAEPDTWPERVFRAVEESQKQGFGGKLIDAIEIERPDTERITSLRQRLAELQKSTIASDGDPPMPAETNSTASLSASGKIPVVPDRDRGSHTGRWTEAPQAFQTWMLGLLIALLVVVVALVV